MLSAGVSAKGISSEQRRVLEGLKGRIEPVAVSPLYRLGLLLVAVVMIVLPVIYVSLIAGVAWFLYLHATNQYGIEYGELRGKAVALVYAGPLAIGGILLLFMIKPLFAPKPKEPPRVTLERGNEPLLFAFVERLCEVVGAPKPREIRVDCEANASAGFRRGVLSMLGRGDLVLTIGLPLVAGLNLRQLTGVLAHEFGHFAQGTGMRLTYLIRSINGWFARVVYERDAWDERLVSWAREGGSGWISLVLWVAQGMVWLTRRVLWALMWAGHVVSSFMLRQMEFDADRYEARVAGSNAFAETSAKLPLLGIASQGAYSDLGQAWNDRRLCDDLPGLIMANVGQIPAKLRQDVERMARERRTGWFDSHPADKDRVASAAREKAAGLFTIEEPATALFVDFASLSRDASMAFYRAVLGPAVEQGSLVSTEQLCRSQVGQVEAHKAMRRYFQDKLTGIRAVFPVETALIDEVEGDAAEALMEARSGMQLLLAGMGETVKQIEQADDKLTHVRHVRMLREAGFKKIDAASFGMQRGDQQECEQVEAEGQRLRSSGEKAMAELELLSGRRLQAAMALATEEGIRAELGDSALAEARRMTEVLSALRQAYSTLMDLRNDHLAIIVLLNNLDAGGDKVRAGILELSRRCAGHLRGLHALLKSVAYPFEHARRGLSVGAYAMETLPAGEDVNGVLSGNQTALDGLFGVYFRATATLAQFAERVETAMGLPMAEEPKEEAVGQN